MPQKLIRHQLQSSPLLWQHRSDSYSYRNGIRGHFSVQLTKFWIQPRPTLWKLSRISLYSTLSHKVLDVIGCYLTNFWMSYIISRTTECNCKRSLFFGAFSTLRPFGLLYSCSQQVPAFISRGATPHTDTRDLYQRRRELLPNFASKFEFTEIC